MRGSFNGKITGFHPVVKGSIPLPRTNGDVAHQVEQQTENLCVVGSSPTVATKQYADVAQ